MDGYGLYLVGFLMALVITVAMEESSTTIRPLLCEMDEKYSQTCSNINLQSQKRLPSFENQSDARQLFFKESVIPVLKIEMFNSYTNLENLYLNNTGLEIMSPGAFGGLAVLKELHINNNKIKELLRGSLNFMPSLKVLDISYNALSNIELGALSGLYNLELLTLAHNNLKILDPSNLVALHSLRELDISFNFLTNLASGESSLYYDLPKLRKVRLNNNQLKKFPAFLVGNAAFDYVDISHNVLDELNFTSFLSPAIGFYSNNKIANVIGWENVHNAAVIDLSGNILQRIESKSAVDVKLLILSNNRFELLANNTLVEFKSLNHLDLSHNRIKTVQEETFKGLHNITHLNLSNNVMEELPVGCFHDLKSLVELKLSNNSLKRIQYGTFTGLENLLSLRLDYNNLDNLHETSFYVLKKLQELYLSNNDLKSLHVLELKNALPDLKKIDINSNKIDCKQLLTIINALKTLSVDVVEGSSFTTSNIFGIVCVDLQSNNATLTGTGSDDTTFSNYTPYLLVLVFILVILIINLTLNSLRLICWFRQKLDNREKENNVEMKLVSAETIKSKLDSSENVYSNIV